MVCVDGVTGVCRVLLVVVVNLPADPILMLQSSSMMDQLCGPPRGQPQ